MNRSSARLTQTFLALSVLTFGATGCSAPTTATPGHTSSAASSAAKTSAPAVASPVPAPGGVSATNAANGLRAAAASKALTPSSPTTGRTKTGVTISRGTLTSCPAERGWGTRPASGSAAMSEAPLYLTRVGRHECFDRVVFDINGPRAVGFVARYVPVVLADASGKPVPVAGRAALEVTVRAPIYGTDNLGHQPGRTPPTVGESLITPAAISGWPSLRAVRFAGSFEGQTTVAVGARERLPFRAFVTSDGSYQHLVLDIAH
jgi:hypothetical protein